MQDLLLSYRILNDIYTNRAYASIELGKSLEEAKSKDFVTKLVYGVLEKDVQLNYYINLLTVKKPKNSIILVLKIGMYCIKYMNSMPDYATVSNCVLLAEKINKKELKGFVNAVLKKYILVKDNLPEKYEERLSVETSTPLWLVNLYLKEYGDETEKFLKCNHTTLEHVRINRRLYSIQELEKTLVDSGLEYKKSIEDALYVQNSNVIRKLFDKGLVTIQSLTSMECAKSLDVKDGHKVLDVCAAPGGKSEYLSELAKIDLISCDIHDHRLNLIKSYFSRMHTQGCNVVKNNGTILREEYINKFDRVLCDVPCSGLGIIHKKPDILLNLERKDIDSLVDVQKGIINTSAKYVKKHGKLVYSTCTILKEENEEIVNEFLKENKEYKMLYQKQFLPSEEHDGFYIAVLEKL